ncbi:HlyD family efflux transporter periplasmic adaptor subunit [Fundidesulfovibrio butyratiphilus]
MLPVRRILRLPERKQRPAPPAERFAAFQPPARAIETGPPPMRARLTLHLAALFLVCLLIFACVAKVDRVVTAQGKLLGPGENLVVQTLEPSIIREIHVSPGQRVTAGQALITLDPTFADTGLEEQAKRLASLKAQAWRLECETAPACPKPQDIDPQNLAAQRELMARRKQEHQAKVQSLVQSVKELEAKLATNARAAEQARKQIRIAQELESMHRDVFERGASSRLEYMKAQSGRIDAETQLVKLGSESKELAQSLERAKAEKESYESGWRSQALKDLVETRRDIEQTAERERKAAHLSEMVVLRAPADGTVLELAKRSVGSVLDKGDAAAVIVPADAKLEAEAEVRAADVGYVREGDTARVKLEAFPFQRHGVLEGRVRTLSAAALEKNPPEGGAQAFYRARIALSSTELRAVPKDAALLPGMTLTAEIAVGKRRIITYLLYPLIKTFDETMREP